MKSLAECIALWANRGPDVDPFSELGRSTLHYLRRLAEIQGNGNFTYPHMCRDEHQEIGHRDSEHERCPLCRANDRLAEAEALLRESADQFWGTRKSLGDRINAFLAAPAASEREECGSCINDICPGWQNMPGPCIKREPRR